MREYPVILIVDDDLGFQEIVGTTLKRNSFAVVEAHNGAEAVDKATKLHPDLVLMDINMPNESGTEAVLDLIKNPETRDIKVIFLTNLKDPWPEIKATNEKVAKELGAAEFLNKSDDLEKIVSKVKETIAKPTVQQTPSNV